MLDLTSYGYIWDINIWNEIVLKSPASNIDLLEEGLYLTQEDLETMIDELQEAKEREVM